MFAQLFQHVKGQRTALVGLLIEKAKGSNFVFVLCDVAGKASYGGLCLRFRLLVKTRKDDLIQVDMVNDLLTVTAGVFYFFSQFWFIKWCASSSYALSARGLYFFGEQGIFTTGNTFGFCCCQRHGSNGIRVKCDDQTFTQFANGYATRGFFYAGLCFVVQLFGQTH